MRHLAHLGLKVNCCTVLVSWYEFLRSRSIWSFTTEIASCLDPQLHAHLEEPLTLHEVAILPQQLVHRLELAPPHAQLRQRHLLPEHALVVLQLVLPQLSRQRAERRRQVERHAALSAPRHAHSVSFISSITCTTKQRAAPRTTDRPSSPDGSNA